MTKIDYYKGLDKDNPLTVEISMAELAAKVCAMNFGAHRLLSAMVHELRRKQFDYIQGVELQNAGKPDNQKLIIKPVDERSPLADAIAAALNSGHTH